MSEQKHRDIRNSISIIYLLVSICLVLAVCAHCYPAVGQKLRHIIVGATDSPVREAFGVLADGLTEDKPVKEVLSQSYEVLVGEEN